MTSAEKITKCSNRTKEGGNPSLSKTMFNVLEQILVGEHLSKKKTAPFHRSKSDAEALETMVSIFIGGIVSTHTNMVNGPEGNISIEF